MRVCLCVSVYVRVWVCQGWECCWDVVCCSQQQLVGRVQLVGMGLPTIQLEYKWMCPIISQKMIKYKNKSNLALILG